MDSYYGTRDTQPITWWGRMPVYSATLLVIAHCLTFVLLALANPLGYGALIPHFVFSTSGLLEQFQIWQVFTYAFLSPLSLWFLVEMAMLFFFGQEVEKQLGRRIFLTLYTVLVLVPPAFLTLAGIFGASSVLAGSSAVHFAVFLAFVTLAPNAQFFFGIPAKWLAVGFFIFNSLILFSFMDWSRLTALWLDTAVAILLLRACGVHSLQFDFSSRRSEPTGIPSKLPIRQKKAAHPQKVSAGDPLEVIDPILDKISTTGLQSLTPAERQRLEKARAALLEKEKSN